jgi:alpha-tubulin suppressor-like RCC1 family protein
MTTLKHLLRTLISGAVVLAACNLNSTSSSAATLNAIYNSATDVPVTANDYIATGNTLNITLNFAPVTGTELMVVSNTALGFINGTFDNLTNGQPVALSYSGITYNFVANYYGGSGNDLVLVWATNRLFGWGWNSRGQLGNSSCTTYFSATPVVAIGVLAGKTVIAVAAAAEHSIALCSDGTVATWGDNSFGQLGDSTVAHRSTPGAVNMAPGVSALYGKRVIAVAAGNAQSLALCSDGTVAAWGDNSSGQLGDNTTTNRLVPVAVSAAPGSSALFGKKVVAIAAGDQHSLALCDDGTVVAWGSNYYGQLGDLTSTDRWAPIAVTTYPGVSSLYGKNVVKVACGGLHSVALCADGTVSAWGYNFNAQLGVGTITLGRASPTAVDMASAASALRGKTVVEVVPGTDHNLALCSDGTFAGWGSNGNGELGTGNTIGPETSPVAVNTNSGVSALYGKAVAALTAGRVHSLVLCSDGTLAAWGYNDYGVLGNDTTTLCPLPLAVTNAPLAFGERFIHLASGPTAWHCLAIAATPPSPQILLASAQNLTNGPFQFTFTSIAGVSFSVLGTTNPALPLNSWVLVGSAAEISSGQYQFTDLRKGKLPQQFYRVRWP